MGVPAGPDGEVAAERLLDAGGLVASLGELAGDEGGKTLLGVAVVAADEPVEDGGLAAEVLEVVAVEVEHGLPLQQVEALLDVRVLHRLSARVSSEQPSGEPTARRTSR